MKILFALLLSCGLCGAFEILPPDFVSVPGKVCLGWQGVTNNTLELWASGDLQDWQFLTNKTGVTGSAAGADGFQIPVADLAGYGTYTTNITEEFHGYAWVMGMDMVQRYVWVDSYARTNIEFQASCFFRLLAPVDSVPAHYLFVSFTAGLMTVRFIFKAL